MGGDETSGQRLKVAEWVPFDDYTVCVRERTVVVSFRTVGGEHRLRLVEASAPGPLLADLWADNAERVYGVRVVDRNVTDGGQREVERFSVSVQVDDTFDRWWREEVTADAVEYLGPDDVLPRRWPDRADVWEHARLPLEYGA